MRDIAALLRRAWEFFGIIEPHLGISFGAIYLGIFVVALSARFLVPLLGIGGKTIDGGSRVTGKLYSYKQSSRRNKEMLLREKNRKGDG